VSIATEERNQCGRNKQTECTIATMHGSLRSWA
jgi:hypothetical protein